MTGPNENDDESDDGAEARSVRVIDQIFHDEEGTPDGRAYALAERAQRMVDQLEDQLAAPAGPGVYLDTGRIERMERPELEAHARLRGLSDARELSDRELRDLVRRSRSP